VLLAGIGSVPLIDPDEGRYAWAARVMARDGLSLTPYFNHEPRFAKPAPITWLQALSCRALGESEGALRLPGALLALAAVVVVHGVAAEVGGAWAGLLAGAILVTSFRFPVVARQALVDAPLTLAFAGAMAALRRVVVSVGEAERARALLGAHVFIAMGVLLKGPIAILLPWLALGVYALAGRRRDLLVGARAGRAILVLAAIALPYFLGMLALHGPAWLREVVVRQHVERFRGIDFGQPSERGLDYFLQVLPGDLLPWTPAMVVALVLLWRGRATWSGAERESHRFLLAWVGVTVAVFSLSRFKLPHYVLPAFAPLAVVTGVALGRPGTSRLAGAVATLPGIGTLAVLAFAAARGLGEATGTAPALLAVGLVASLAFAVALLARPPARAGVLLLAGVTALAYVALSAGVAPVLAARYRPERRLAAAVPAGARVGLYSHWSSAFIYYAGRRVAVVTDHEDLERFARSGGRAVVLCPDPPPPEVLASGGRLIDRGEVLAPRLEDLWRPRPPAYLALYEVTR
jgi:4-amino-4-deoxy-L-arabinose transferase-like glycosyltransferase